MGKMENYGWIIMLISSAISAIALVIIAAALYKINDKIEDISKDLKKIVNSLERLADLNEKEVQLRRVNSKK